MCFSRIPWASDRSGGPPPAVGMCSGGIAFSFRGGVVPGLRHWRQSGQGTAPWPSHSPLQSPSGARRARARAARGSCGMPGVYIYCMPLSCVIQPLVLSIASASLQALSSPDAGRSTIPDSTELRGKGCHHSAKASGSEDLQIEEPVGGGYASAFHFDPTLAGMLGSTLIGHQVIQVGEAREKGLLTAVWVMEALHHEQFPLDGVMGLIQQGAGDGHLRIFEDRIPARLLGLKPFAHACA